MLTSLAIFLLLLSTIKSNAQSFITALPLVGGTLTTSSPMNVSNDLAGNLYCSGSFFGTIDFDPSSEVFNLTAVIGRDNFLAKYNSEGEFQWAMTILSDSKVEITESGVIFLVGTFSGTVNVHPGVSEFNLTSSGLKDIYVVRFNIGNSVSSISSFNAVRIGGSNSEKVDDITLDASGNVVVVGEFNGFVDFNPGAGVLTLSSGIGTITARYLLKLGIADLSFISAQTYTVSGTTITVLNPTNNVEYITIPVTSARVENVLVDGDNNVYMVGSKLGVVEAVFDVATIFAQRIGGYSKTFDSYTADLSDAAIDEEGNLYLTGSYNRYFEDSPIHPFRGSSFIVKLNSTGSIAWEKYILSEFDGEYGLVEGLGITVDNDGYVYATGATYGLASLDLGEGADEVEHNNYLVKYSPSGDFEWVIGDIGLFKKLSVSNNSSIWISGTFAGTTDFDPGPDVYNITASAFTNGYLLNLGISNCVSSPYSVNDTIWQQVIENDSYCCGTEWDETCQNAYNTIEAQGCVESPYAYDDPIYLDVIQDDDYCCSVEWDGVCQEAYEAYLDDCAESPYDSNDPIYLQVIYQDPYCCSTTWDGICEESYDELSVGSTIEGSVAWNTGCGIRPAVLQLYNPGSTFLAHQYNVGVFFNGQFLIDQGGALGTFDVFLKVDGYLRKSIGTQTFGSANQFSFGALTPGDLNGDNQISVVDISLLSISFGKTADDEDFNILADLNCDGNVNVTDISLLGSSFGLVGASPPL